MTLSNDNIEVKTLPTPKYSYITKEEEAKRIISELINYNVLSIDTETTALDPFLAKLSLVQIGAGDNLYVFDVRYDTRHSNIHPSLLSPIFLNPNIVKVFQNALFDMKILKRAIGKYVVNVYDTMLAEQLLHLGLDGIKYSLAALVFRYLGVHLPKEPAKTFTDYDMDFQPFQLEYAANDVAVLEIIKDLQESRIKQEGLEGVCQLEFDFLKPLCEMELNGIKIDVDKWRILMSDIEVEMYDLEKEIEQMLLPTKNCTPLFGVSTININSQKQLLKALHDYGLPDLESTDVKVISKYTGVPVIDKLLQYRKTYKLVSTYGETLLGKIHPITGRLHTDFRQMVSTGRLSSSNPNLQNIPKKQKYRTGFIAKDGYSLLKADMGSAELRIIGNLSKDPLFVKMFAEGLDLHKMAGSAAFKVAYDEVTTEQRNKAKGLSFGLPYGISKVGLARNLKITEEEAQDMIDGYFNTYIYVKSFLDESAQQAVNSGYVRTISGRKRYFALPPAHSADYKTKVRSVMREGKNAPVQGANADTIKKSMIYLIERLEAGEYDAKLVLSVHDEVVVECKNDQVEEVSKIVSSSIIDGFGYYFSLIPMITDVLIGPCWMKEACEAKNVDGKKCGCSESVFVDDTKYKTKLVCKKCGNLL